MKKRIVTVMLLTAFIFAFSSCNDKEKEKEPVKASATTASVTEEKYVAVTNADGRTVTDASGQAVTETVAVKKVEKEVTVAVTDKSGETVTNKNGEAVTEKKTVTEYVTVPTTKTKTTTTKNSAAATTKPASTTTTTKVQSTTATTVGSTTTTHLSGKTINDLTYRKQTKKEEELFNLINKTRADNGLQQLTWNPTVAAFTDIRVKEFASNTDLAHSRPDGTKWSSLFKEYSVSRGGGGGENLCMIPGANNSAADIHQTFVESPSHYNNMLGETLSVGAVSIYSIVDNKGMIHTYCCEIFIEGYVQVK